MSLSPLASANLSVWEGYQAFYKVVISQDTTDLTWRRLLDEVEPMFGLAAEFDQQLVGIAHCILHRSSWTETDYCYLQDLFVEEEARTRGVGRLLIEGVIAAAREHKCSRVYLLTKEDNNEARRLYEKVFDLSGFIQYRKLL